MQSTSQDKPEEFVSSVIEYFKFLEIDYNFLCRSSKPQKYTRLVIYENHTLYVILSYGPPDYEPGMCFGRRGIDDIPGGYSFDSGDLIQLDCCRNWTWNKDHDNALTAHVAWFAQLIAVCGNKCLSGDNLIFTQMKNRRDNLFYSWMHDENLKRVRAQIDSAWKVKDYKQVLRLYESIDDLSDLDKKRIVYATAHV